MAARSVTDDPLERFQDWFREAEQAGVEVPEAMTLATADCDGVPSARMVLLKGADDEGFVFYSGYVQPQSRRARPESSCGACLLLAAARHAGPGRRAGRAGLRSRIGRLLRNAAARQPAGGVGVAAEPAPGEPRRSSSAATPSSSASTTGGRCRGRHTGAATGYGRTRSSSGSIGRTGCTTAFVTRARARAGGRDAQPLMTPGRPPPPI